MLKIFNTLSNKKEVFKSIQTKHVNIYVCGVTVYALCHIGHGRTFIIFDMIIRYLKFLGYTIQYVRNITDIDDKIIQQLVIHKKDLKSFTNDMIKAMHIDFSILNLIKPTNEPLTTVYIPFIIQFIKKLLKNKCAYIATNGDVLFSVKSLSSYGKLSNQKINFLKLGNRNLKLEKKDPLDFIVWKLKSNNFLKISSEMTNELFWSSPWGIGRPGWHIECSAISQFYFGHKLDIHGGGNDLLFPHHENERSQSICINNKENVKYWVHAGLLVIDNEKMSKSLNNCLTLKTVLQLYDSEIVRYYFLSTHYRKPLHFYHDSLKQSEWSLRKIYFALKDMNCNVFLSYKSLSFELSFKKAMNDDFNTPKAISILFILVKKIKFLKLKDINKANELAARLRQLGNILGLLFHEPNTYLCKKNQCNTILSINKIKLLIQIRNNARKLKNWKKADALRNKLFKLRIVLRDSKNVTLWEYY